MHNVRGVHNEENLFNEIHLAQAPDKQMRVNVPVGEAVQLKCDIHPWMSTWVYVHDSAAVGVTGADGKFRIGDVPPGSYELEVWHPYLGTKKVNVKVAAGETVTVEPPAFAPADYKAPPQ